MSTRDRAIEVASAAFADRGVAGTSLDDLARSMGVTKQTILYHFKSKDGLLEVVVEQAAASLRDELDRAVTGATLEGSATTRLDPAATEVLGPWDQVEAVVRAAFALAVARPELLGVLREVSRLGPPHSDRVIDVLAPLIERAVAALDAAMDAGDFRPTDPRLLLVSAYGAVTGAVTDASVLRAVGLDLDLRVAARLRRTVLDLLRAALAPPGQ